MGTRTDLTVRMRCLGTVCWAGEAQVNARMTDAMDGFTADELREALEPIASLISKSDKACRRLAPHAWQRSMLEASVRALRLASALIAGGSDAVDGLTPDDRDQALGAIESMARRTESAQSRFAAGTSQHTLLRNRLKALRVAEAVVRSATVGE